MASRFLAPFGSRGLLGGDPFLDLHREVNRLFDDSFRGMARGSGGQRAFGPNIDVNETEDGLELTAELPGVAEEDIDLRLDGDILTISGEKRSERKDESSRLVERSYGSFSRSIQLPFTPDAEKVEADCDRGVLSIKLPRSVEQDKSRRISVGKRQGSGQQTIDVGSSPDGQPAVGKDWSRSTETGTAGGEPAEEAKGERTSSS